MRVEFLFEVIVVMAISKECDQSLKYEHRYSPRNQESGIRMQFRARRTKWGKARGISRVVSS